MILKLYLACLFSTVIGYRMDIDPEILRIQLQEYLVFSLKQKEMQDYLNQLSFLKEELVAEQLLDSLVLSFGEGYKQRIEVVKSLRKAVEQVYFDTSSELSACCNFAPPVTYDERFLRPVGFEDSCNLVSPATAPNPTLRLKQAFKSVCEENFKNLPSIKWQYFGSEEGVTSVYPAMGHHDACDSYDCRLRPWYVQASVPQEKQVVVVVDKSGSMSEIRNGIDLLTMAKSVAKTIVRTMNPNDQVALLAISGTEETLSDFHSHEKCFKTFLAQATPQNKEKINEFLDSLVASGGTHYSRAMAKAFDFFLADFNTSNNSNKVIHFISDGTPNDSPKEIRNTLVNKHKQLNHTVQVMTYGVGDADFGVLKMMASYHVDASKKGEFLLISDPVQLRNELASFYKFYSSVGETVEEPIWTVPYLDSWGLGQMMTASLPVYVNSELVGVVGVDFTLEDLFAQSTYFHPNELTYSFVIAESGLIINHPLLPYVDQTDSLFVSATAFEKDPEFIPILESMKKGERGTRAFNSTRAVSRGDSRMYGVSTRIVEAVYFWDKIPNTNFSICVVLAGNSSKVLAPQNSLPTGSFLFHRIDLSDDHIKCNHLNIQSSQNRSSVYLAARAYKDPSRYLNHDYTKAEMEGLKDYIEGNGPDVHNLRLGVKDEIVASHHAEVLWTRQDENNVLEEDVFWRIIGTKSGIFRSYPGRRSSRLYDPINRPWFQQTFAHRESLATITAPYKDEGSGHSVITISQVLLKESSVHSHNHNDDELFAIMGMDFILLHFHHLFLQWYPICKDTNIYRCYLIDNAGFIITLTNWDAVEGTIEDFFKKRNWRAHLSQIEPEITNLLIRKNILQSINCSNIEAGLFQKTYLIPEDQGAFWGTFENSFFDVFDFKLVPVEGTNTFILIHLYTESACSKVAFSCYCLLETCRSHETRNDTCECPCASPNPYFDTCRNEYNSVNSPPPCTPSNLRVGFDTDFIDANVQSYPLCYNHSFSYAGELNYTLYVVLLLLLVGIAIAGTLAFKHYLPAIMKAAKNRKLEKDIVFRRALYKIPLKACKKYKQSFSSAVSENLRHSYLTKSGIQRSSEISHSLSVSEKEDLMSYWGKKRIFQKSFDSGSGLSIKRFSVDTDRSTTTPKEGTSMSCIGSTSTNSTFFSDQVLSEHRRIQMLRESANVLSSSLASNSNEEGSTTSSQKVRRSLSASSINKKSVSILSSEVSAVFQKKSTSAHSASTTRLRDISILQADGSRVTSNEYQPKQVKDSQISHSNAKRVKKTLSDSALFSIHSTNKTKSFSSTQHSPKSEGIEKPFNNSQVSKKKISQSSITYAPSEKSVQNNSPIKKVSLRTFYRKYTENERSLSPKPGQKNNDAQSDSNLYKADHISTQTMAASNQLETHQVETAKSQQNQPHTDIKTMENKPRDFSPQASELPCFEKSKFTDLGKKLSANNQRLSDQRDKPEVPSSMSEKEKKEQSLHEDESVSFHSRDQAKHGEDDQTNSVQLQHNVMDLSKQSVATDDDNPEQHE